MKNHLLSFSLAAIGFLLLSSLWQAFVPVVIFMKSEGQVILSNRVILKRVTGYKIRDCKFIPNSKYGQAMVDGVWEEVPFEFVAEVVVENSKPKSWQKQSFGHWQWSLARYPSASHVRLVTFHDCGEDIVTSIYGDWKIE